jgi:tRNA(fMet)-specific endonuclease VapC
VDRIDAPGFVIYLLDSDLCIEVLRRREPVASRVEGVSPADLAIATMTEAELEYGVLRHPHPNGARERLDRFLATPVQVLSFDRSAARAHAHLRDALRRQPIGPHDLIIASVAVANDLILVTRNQREFGRVPGLALEDWTERV